MSDPMNLQILAQHRQDILLAEVAALLHDVGKFTDLHVKHHAVNGSRKWSNDDAYKAIVDNPGSVIRLSEVAANIKKPDILNNVLNAGSPKAADFLPAGLKSNLQSSSITLFGQSYSLAELILLGTPGFATYKQREQLLLGKDGWLPAVLGLCHNVAHVDKEEPMEGKQSLPNVLASNAFGYEQQTFVIGNRVKSLDARLKKFVFNPTDLSTTRLQTLKAFECGLGDTRRPINEVLLSDWAWIVAALFKSALADALLKNKQLSIRQWKNWKEKIIDHDFSWRILRVNFDELGLYAKAVKIGDLLGYRKAVEQACQAVKQLIEEEYPLGNEIYRDTTGIYFTFPNLDLPTDLEREIRHRIEKVEPELAPRISTTQGDGDTPNEQLKKILAKARSEASEALAQPFDPQNLTDVWQNAWKDCSGDRWEVCPVCRLRPMKEGQEACDHCLKRRRSRIDDWMKEPCQTIWMDEIADHNGRVALLVGKFGLEDWLSGDLVQTMLVRAKENNPQDCVPKNPSPARLRRIWQTCQNFWEETVIPKILNNRLYGKTDQRCKRLVLLPDNTKGWIENVPYDGMMNGKAISLLWLKDDERFITISNLEWATPQPNHKIRVTDPHNPRQFHSFTIQAVNKAPAHLSNYKPFLPLLTTPDRFLVLVPANEALEIAEAIRQQYHQQFGKVQNRLPIFLGLIFFDHKMPLLAAIETARRMLTQVKFVEEEWTVESNCPSKDELSYQLSLKFNNQLIEWNVPVKMGDNTTKDVWYPYYFAAKQNPDNRRYRFDLQLKGQTRWLIHVEDLQKGDTVCITPSRFGYVFLESPAQRFQFDPQKDVWLLDDLPRLLQLWQTICRSPDITDTRLQAICALFEAKRQQWKLDQPTPQSPITDEVYRHLVETTLTRNNLSQIDPQDVLNGRFQYCVDLYLHVLKNRVANARKQN